MNEGRNESRKEEGAAQARPDRKRVSTLYDGVLGSDRAALARAITLIESRLESDIDDAQELLGRLLPKTGQALRIGITGVPGVGKSTFIETFGLHLIEQGHRVAVLAVDPSSSLSGGSILGDKARMHRLSQRSEAFIRPSPSQGSLGGVAGRTRETMIACETAGYDVVLVETVGVGQSETTVAEMVDVFLVLMLPGAGDELQGIKRGVLELADIVAVNKADGDNKARATLAQTEYASALRYMGLRADGSPRTARTVSALTGDGVPSLWKEIESYAQSLSDGAFLEAQRRRQRTHWLRTLLEEALLQRLRQDPDVEPRLAEAEEAVAEGKVTPLFAVRDILRHL